MNLMNSILSKTGGRPIIRIGGTSAYVMRHFLTLAPSAPNLPCRDHAKFIPSQAEPALPVADANHAASFGNGSIGPSFWQTVKNFTALNATFIVQVPLATTNVTESVSWAKAAVDGLGMQNIDAIEIGNEPDLYPSAGDSGHGWRGKLTNQS